VSNIFNIFRYEFIRNLKRGGYLFTTFGLPVLALALLFFINATSGGDGISPTDQLENLEFDIENIEQAGYVDLTGVFDKPGEFADDLMQPFGTQAAAESALENDVVDVYFVIPEDYFERGEVQLYAPRFSFTVFNDDPVRQLFFSQLIEQGVNEQSLALINSPANIRSFETTEPDATAEAGEEDQLSFLNVLAIILGLSLFSTNGYLLQSVIEEKESRLIEILIASVQPTQLLMGKVFALGLLGLLQVMVYGVALIIGASIASDSFAFLEAMNVTFDILVVAVTYFLLGYLLYAAFFGGIGALSNSVQDASGFVTVIVLLILSPYFFIGQFINTPDAVLPVFFSYFPLTSPLGMTMRYVVSDINALELSLSLFILIGSIFGLMWMAGRLFRVQTLLSGNMPKLTRIPALIFGKQ
jgi:ABC-2 type transport system permease protein